MKLIAAVDKNGGIGYQNKLLVQIPQDMKNFQNLTMGQVLVMGRKTLESFPGGRPLQGRINLVLSRNQNYQVKSAEVLHSVEETLEKIKEYPGREVFVIGGEEIYEQFLPYASEIYLTYIDYKYLADAYFPKLDMTQWQKVEESEEQTYFNLEYYFQKYVRT